MKILLTGASGFLGSALARHWVDCGYDIWLLVRPTSILTGNDAISSYVHVIRFFDLEEIPAIIRDISPEVVVHTACSYGRRGETSLDILAANFVFGAYLIQGVMESHGSDTNPTTFINTGTALSSKVSIYAHSKAQFSAWGKVLATQNPGLLRFIDIQLQQMYGPNDDHSKFTTQVINACHRSEPSLALTAGMQRRDFIHIDDVVSAYERILSCRSTFSTADTIDVGSGSTVKMREFVKLAKYVSGAKTQLNFGAVPYRADEAMLCVADTTRLRSLGWRPKVSLTEGLMNLFASLRRSEGPPFSQPAISDDNQS